MMSKVENEIQLAERLVREFSSTLQAKHMDEYLNVTASSEHLQGAVNEYWELCDACLEFCDLIKNIVNELEKRENGTSNGERT